MDLLITLAQDGIPFAKEEIKALLGVPIIKGKYAVVKSLTLKGARSAKRIAYAKEIYHILATCSKRNELTSIPWSKWVNDSYCVRTKDITVQEITKSIHSSFQKNKGKNKTPKVNCTNPKIEIFVLQLGKKIYITKRIKMQKGSFEERKAQKRPIPQPISMHPRLARAMVNITGVKGRETILDPLCGIGGIPLEAALMKLNIYGSDINPWMINASKVNCKHYKVSPNLRQGDVFKIKKKATHVVTDLPYAKNTRNVDEMFYKKFFKKLPQLFKKRAVIGLHTTKRIRLPKELKLIKKLEHYHHRKLSKQILIIEKRK